MSFRDYAALLERLKRDFPDESFLLVRYGDHQPEFASVILDPSLDETAINRRLMALRPALFHDLLRDRHDQFQTRQSCLGARHARGALSASGHPGGRRAAARSIVCRAKANSRTLQGAVLCLCRRGGGAAFQSAADRCRLDQRALMPQALSWRSRVGKIPPRRADTAMIHYARTSAPSRPHSPATGRPHERRSLYPARHEHPLHPIPCCLWPCRQLGGRVPVAAHGRRGLACAHRAVLQSPGLWRLARSHLQRRNHPPGGAGN